MNLRHLQYLIVLEKTGNMTQAAAELFVSQSNLSQFLSSEEKKIGQKLFQRQNNRYVPTPVGEIYLDYAKKMIALGEELEEALATLAPPSIMRIGISSSSAIRMLDAVLPKFNKMYSNIQVSVLNCSNLNNAIYALSNNNLDLVFVTAHAEHLYPGGSRVFAREEIKLAVPASHVGCQQLDLDEETALTTQRLIQLFGNSPFVLQYKGSCIRYLVDDFFKDTFFEPGIACNATDIHAIEDMIANKIGLGFVPVHSISNLDSVRYFSLKPSLYRIHTAYLGQSCSTSAPAKALIKMAEQYYHTAFETPRQETL